MATQHFDSDMQLDNTPSKLYLLRIQTANGEYEGVFQSAFPSKRLSEVLVGVDDFINLKDVKDISTEGTFPFMVIGKAHIETIKVLEEREEKLNIHPAVLPAQAHPGI